MTNPFVWLLDRLADFIGPALEIEFSDEDIQGLELFDLDDVMAEFGITEDEL